MSEITRGVIGMPFKLAMGSEMSRRQFHACAQEVFVEKEQLEARLHEVAVCCATAEQERDQIKAESEALRKDAERYRWLLAKFRFSVSDPGDLGKTVTGLTFVFQGSVRGEVSESIDAAMSAEASHD